MYNQVRTLDTVTGNLAVILHFHHFQVNDRYDFFSFLKLFFIQNYRFLYHGDQRSPGGESAGGGRSTS